MFFVFIKKILENNDGCRELFDFYPINFAINNANIFFSKINNVL